ncbi:putative polysaccharide biosynthesis protein [Thermoclostridium caenicola]|uniref:Stage V sporulation protein B n=1 Tax=Thermoclostridium caenicola TaxID=659425 RepID=A0A1M6CYX1_9FIRM|nr:polysaccharide biosynthesis protein [Thermoclostridium caenicola]SHI66222.1 stage V sporulation protein B [Thermoclostridium caenicola]HOP71951.1 polysaccharide biosynthesis protein [Thermoclostridium caenicola]
MARRSLKYNAAVLSITGFLVKAIGFFYRIFIANCIGAEGLGLYQLIVPIYSLLVLVLSAGISVAVSRFVAEETSSGRIRAGMKIASLAAGVVLVTGVVVSLILILNVDTMLLAFAKDLRARRSLLWMLALVPPIAAASAYKGYFYGKEQVIPNAIGQVAEQLSKLAFVVVMHPHFVNKGIESMCLLATLGLMVGECVNVFCVFCAFQYEKFKNRARPEREIRTRTLAKKLVRTALPISANRLVLSVLGTVESLIIPQRLTLSGLTFQESLEVLGRLNGMAAPLVFFPSMLPMALATALVPAIAGAVSSGRYAVANRQISQSIRLTLTMGLVFTAFFAICSHEIAEFIYPGKDVGHILHLLSYTGVFLYLQQTMLGILNGLARESAILCNTLTGSIVRILLVWFCLPIWGTDAYIVGVIAGSLITIILNFLEISRITGMSIDIGEWFIKPLAATLAGALLSLLIKRIPGLWGGAGRLQLLIPMVISFAVIVVVFMVTGVIRSEDIRRWTRRNHAALY